MNLSILFVNICSIYTSCLKESIQHKHIHIMFIPTNYLSSAHFYTITPTTKMSITSTDKANALYRPLSAS